MPLLAFLLRQFLAGAVARPVTKAAANRFNLSPEAANLLFFVLTALLSRGTSGRGFLGRWGKGRA